MPTLARALVIAALAVAPLVPPTASVASAGEVVAPIHAIEVSGMGVATYPAFDPAVERYAVTTSASTGGALTVRATTSDPDGTVWVDGRPAGNGSAHLTGLAEGDEVSVIFEDAAGLEVHSFIYLPAGFPTLEVTVRQPGVSPGSTALTLNQWNTALPTFEAAIDSSGVPVYVRSSATGTLDLKLQPNGHYSVARSPSPTPGRTGAQIVELDSAFREVGRYETVGRQDTDRHDSVLLPGGGRILIGYEPDVSTGLTDAVIQEVDAAGDVVFEWDSSSLRDETLAPGPDYAHINSVVVMADGDLLASFRHLSTVLKIARSDHDGFSTGDVVWKLGGRDSTFSFPAGDGGPCAQHTASELANGDILVFDNGSGWPDNNLCIDPADPAGSPIARPQTRVTQYSLDTATGLAQVAWQWDGVPGRFGLFAGSAQRLANGNTMVGWAGVPDAIATEVSPAGELLWEIKDAATDVTGAGFYSSYRALKFAVPDTIAPQVEVMRPRAGTTYGLDQRVTAVLSCTDRGGSSLHTCGSAMRSGDRLDTTTPGRHELVVQAVDGAGDLRTLTRSYTVARAAAYQPDARIRRLPHGHWVGGRTYGGAPEQKVRQRVARGATVATQIRIRNDGGVPDRFTVRGGRGGQAFRVRYVVAGRDVTRAVTRGTFRTDRLTRGDLLNVTVRVTRRSEARAGQSRTITVGVRSLTRPARRDAVATVVKARG